MQFPSDSVIWALLGPSRRSACCIHAHSCRLTAAKLARYHSLSTFAVVCLQLHCTAAMHIGLQTASYYLVSFPLLLG